MQLLTEIRIAGFGGQGVILAAAVIGKAAAIFEGGYATMTQSFGPEARGGSSSAQVILSTEPILYPYVTQPDILVVMSQEAYTRLLSAVEARRHPDHRAGAGPRRSVTRRGPRLRCSRHPAGRRARPQGRPEYRDGGFFGAVTNLLDPDALRKAVADSVPPAMQKLNLQAFDKGFEYGSQLLNDLSENGDAEQPVALESA